MIEKLFMAKNEATGNGGWTTVATTGVPIYSNSDLKVTKDNAINISTVYAALNIRAGTISKMPIKVYKKDSNGDRSVINDSISYLLNKRPNAYQTPTMFKKLISYNVDLFGDSFVWIETKKGIAVALWVLKNDTCKLESIGGRLWLTFEMNDKKYKIKYEQILHFTDTNFTNMQDGTLNGKSKIDVANEVLVNTKSSTKLLSNYYKNGSLSNGLLTTPQILDTEVKKAIKGAWRLFNGGIDNSDIAVLDGDLKYQSMSNSFKDMCIVELSKLSKEEIATVFQIPLHMLNDLSKSSFSNIQQQSLDFISNTIQPLITGWEEEINYKLFTTEQQLQGYYVKFDEKVALRSDDESRSRYYGTMLQNGVMSINEVRALEEMNGVQFGDTNRVDLNHISIDKADEYQLKKAGGNGDKTEEVL